MHAEQWLARQPFDGQPPWAREPRAWKIQIPLVTLCGTDKGLLGWGHSSDDVCQVNQIWKSLAPIAQTSCRSSRKSVRIATITAIQTSCGPNSRKNARPLGVVTRLSTND